MDGRMNLLLQFLVRICPKRPGVAFSSGATFQRHHVVKPETWIGNASAGRMATASVAIDVGGNDRNIDGKRTRRRGSPRVGFVLRRSPRASLSFSFRRRIGNESVFACHRDEFQKNAILASFQAVKTISIFYRLHVLKLQFGADSGALQK